MKWTASREQLLEELRLIQGAIEKKSTIPTLSYFLVQASDNRLRIVASDMELSYESTIEADVQESGSIALPAKTVTDIVRSFTRDEIACELLQPPVVLMKSGSTRFEVMGLEEQDYPIPRVPELGEEVFELPSYILKQAIDYVYFVIPGHALRDSFMGALWQQEERSFSAAAMDVYRLAAYRAELDTDRPQSFSLLVHRKALNELRTALVSAPLEVVKFGQNANVIVFDLGSRRISIRLIDDTFPDYSAYVPKSAPYKVRLQRVPFLDALKRVVLLSRGSRDSVAPSVRLKPLDDRMELHYYHPALGTASDIVEATFEGEPFSIYVNGEFLIEFLTVVQEEQVELWFTSSKSPAAARPIGASAAVDYFYVFMPIDEKDVEKDETEETPTA